MELIQQPQNDRDFQVNGNIPKLVGVIQTMVTGSFAKKYGNMNLNDVVSVFGVLTSDLSNEQINQGLNTVLQMGFCPDVALFRRWCLGLKGFDNADHIADSYIAKTGALASILAWRDDDTRQITVAEKLAYDDVYHVFEQADRLPSMMITAHVAFMDRYEMVVREMVANRQPCQVWQAPVALEHHEQPEPPKNRATPEQIRALAEKYKVRMGAKPMMAFGANKMDYLGEVA